LNWYLKGSMLNHGKTPAKSPSMLLVQKGIAVPANATKENAQGGKTRGNLAVGSVRTPWSTLQPRFYPCNMRGERYLFLTMSWSGDRSAASWVSTRSQAPAGPSVYNPGFADFAPLHFPRQSAAGKAG